jgi:PRTRC genetic system ThiF family protein
MEAIHVSDNYLLNPTNPVTVNLIGAGGTGSNMVMALAKMNHSLIALGHPGLYVCLYDDDRVSEANLGRQLFAETELRLFKSAALINRVNRFFGTNWKAVTAKFGAGELENFPHEGKANFYISCVDNVKARLGIADILRGFAEERRYERNKPLYWMDLGNGRQTGQAILSTVTMIEQPVSEKYKTVASLPQVTDEFRALLEEADSHDDTPSCSVAEALTKQDLFINPTLANLGASLLWQLFREGILFNRGFFLNLNDFRVQPLKVA